MADFQAQENQTPMVARGDTSIPPGIQEWAKGVRENVHSVIIYAPNPF